jgi:hypothetical protein
MTEEAIPTMDDTVTVDLSISNNKSSLPIKKCWSVGGRIVVVIDNEIVNRLGIDDVSTYVQEEVTNGNILLHVKHLKVEKM